MDLQPGEFKEVTIYTTGEDFWTNIIRIDAKWSKVWIAPHAQYEKSLHVEFIRRGKRKVECLIRFSTPYLVIVSTEYAIDPDGRYLPPVNGVASARYGVADPRWRRDFDNQLLAAKVPILVDFRSYNLDTPANEAKSRPVPLGDVSPDKLSGFGAALGLLPKDSGYEEGVRQRREQFFFVRNPRLVKQAKEIYGCSCQVCGFDFARIYGTIGLDFAEVHHLNPLSERPPDEWTSAVQTSLAEVAILCANCHRMIHRRTPALSIHELKALLESKLRDPGTDETGCNH